VLRHEELADTWADIFEEVGAVPRRELYVAELSNATEEAWLDIAALGVPELSGLLFDVTVRHPRHSRYMPGASTQDGEAMLIASRDKSVRYPDALGQHVATLGHETWGRLSRDAEQILQTCASVAARQDHRRGRVPGNRLQRWRAQLDAALHRAIVAQQLSARWGLPGKPHRRRRRAVDLTALECKYGWPSEQ
jgi:hypothetical protein